MIELQEIWLSNPSGETPDGLQCSHLQYYFTYQFCYSLGKTSEYYYYLHLASSKYEKNFERLFLLQLTKN